MKQILAVLTGLCLMAALSGCTRYVYAGTENSETAAVFKISAFSEEKETAADVRGKDERLVAGGRCMRLSNGWQLEYDSATMTKQLKLPVSFSSRIHIDVLTEGGVLNLRIEDKEGSIIFDEKYLQTGKYSCRCAEHGEYTVYITAEGHQGRLRITD